MAPCFHPLPAGLIQQPGGKRSITFDRKVAGAKAINLPCGRCIGCRLERARQWAVRIVHEMKMHEEAVFVTLTYDEEHLPKDQGLSLRDCQLFLKKLRERIRPVRIRFFLAGEYGEICSVCDLPRQGPKRCLCVPAPPLKIGRPHYHAVIFGYGFPDRTRCGGGDEQPYFHSEELSAVWGNGRALLGAVTFDSASYVANYATKKVHGEKAAAHYGGRRPEFVCMSRRPGLGSGWLRRFVNDVYPSDEVIVRGVSCKPPRYYDKYAAQHLGADIERVKALREIKASEKDELVEGETVPESRNRKRMLVREKVARAKFALKKRGNPGE